MADELWGIVRNGIVEVIPLDASLDPGKIFTPDLTVVNVTAVSGIVSGWRRNADGSFSAPTVSAATPTTSDFLAYNSLKQNQVLAQVWTFDVGASSAPLNVTTRLDAAGQAAMLKLGMWAMLNASNDVTEAYSNVDFSSATLSPAQALALATQAGAIVSQSYVALNTVSAAIKATPPTITTKAAIDAYAWPTAD